MSGRKERIKRDIHNIGITKLMVEGYKSIVREQSIEIRPLTILAGANSSGKSSMIQPLLLLKQTLDSAYDPSVVLINGDHVKFTSTSQFLSRNDDGTQTDSLRIGIELNQSALMTNYYEVDSNRGLQIQKTTLKGDDKYTLRYGMTNKQIRRTLFGRKSNLEFDPPAKFSIVRFRSFLRLGLQFKGSNGEHILKVQPNILLASESESESEDLDYEQQIQNMIHLPGLRGNPERAYPRTASGPTFPGTFEKYAASVITQWEIDDQQDKLDALKNDLVHLGLTWTVSAERIDETQVSLQVGRLCQTANGKKSDLVNISDVGFGTSQTLPILVALHKARPSQLVYIEQPETHLHPRAQHALAKILANAAHRGVRVIVETHSVLLLLAIQSLVAKDEIPNHLVKLHWFYRDEKGCTEVESGDLDTKGAFGPWPEDFWQVQLDAQDTYLDARERKMEGL